MEIKPDAWDEFEFEIDSPLNDFIERGWSKKKLAGFLRKKARELDPPKQRTRVLMLPEVLTMSDKQVEALPENIRQKVKDIREGK